jgi:hypothetical protein
MKQSKIILSAVVFLSTPFAQRDITSVFIPAELAFLLSESYTGDINANFIDTKTSNDPMNAILAVTQNATFYACDEDYCRSLTQHPNYHRGLRQLRP